MGNITNLNHSIDSSESAIVFPGQGIQRRGMGKTLFSRFPRLTEEASSVLGYCIKNLCLNDTDNRLKDTRYTQPAIFVVNALSHAELIERGETPRFYAGHSLGEYNALHAAGILDFNSCLKLVIKRGELLSQANGGGMYAIIGTNKKKLQSLICELSLDRVDIANINSTHQIVLSGDKLQLAALSAQLLEQGLGKSIPLNVSAAFHSRFMQEPARQFSNYLNLFTFKQPHTPVISNVEAKPIEDASKVSQLITKQIYSPVNWKGTMSFLHDHQITKVIETSNSDVLTKLWNEFRDERSKKGLLIDKKKLVRGRGDVSYENSYNRVHLNKDAQLKNVMALGSPSFKAKFGIKYNVVSGAMFRGISSTEIVSKMANAGMIGFFGSGGLALQDLKVAIHKIKANSRQDAKWGANLLHLPNDNDQEVKVVELYLKENVNLVEAAGFISVTSAVVQFRFHGAYIDPSGDTIIPNSVFAKISRPDIAKSFIAPPSEKILSQLLSEGRLTQSEVQIARTNPTANVITVEADSGGHTDGGNISALLPVIKKQVESAKAQFNYTRDIFVGAAGGIGTAESIAAAFILGADYIVTGSINQCSVESGTSDKVKQMLSQASVYDTTYAPAGDMFELGAKVQVLNKGTLFAPRANKLYQLYRQYNGIDEIPITVRESIEKLYFKKSIDDVWNETSQYFRKVGKGFEIEKAQCTPKHKMALIFRWYFAHSIKSAMSGDETQVANFQIHCGPAMGAFNDAVKDTIFASWQNRNVDKIALYLMQEAYELLQYSLNNIITPQSGMPKVS
ncbi:ACP S-malonyltransferase [Endozoicomonas sp. G2_1]|uniref:ACP S-malonyltransferase n=1 Tax=Endozoicomonas sp. G2_1 TaxID=2821091 RepID=UPI001ADA8DD0|nr:ACP S-malonyltransferase [Endozoicomonas sp. G2_1]MBO9489814.1 ACP S-malonyltransferase [Endozoicomonas sp. G2_1]